jgi:hypothetical protein
VRGWQERTELLLLVGGAAIVVAALCRPASRRALRSNRLGGAGRSLRGPIDKLGWPIGSARRDTHVKITRDVALSEALDGISAMIEQLRSSTISVGDRTIEATDRVAYEFEIESSDDGFEIEFEIKWQDAKSGGGESQQQW